MKDPLVMAHVNMWAVLRTLEPLCELDDSARSLASPRRPVSIGINVRGGPQATLSFQDGACRMTRRNTGQIKLLLPSPEDFNRMVDGEKNPLPYAGFPRLGFLLKNFTALTDLLSAYLRPQPSDLEDRGFFERSTTLLFYLVAGALAAVANNDPLGRISAAAIPDGTIALEIQDGPCAEITARGGHLITRRRKAVSPRAYMIFSDFDAARGLFDGTLEAMSALAAGKIIMKGYIPMIDNLNRVLNRVPVYLQ